MKKYNYLRILIWAAIGLLTSSVSFAQQINLDKTQQSVRIQNVVLSLLQPGPPPTGVIAPAIEPHQPVGHIPGGCQILLRQRLACVMAQPVQT